ncbi:putative zinc-containing alcohol dehydrogenase [Atractiella rhizophila]|nr:putative zinc-containing alcohol dehydrogenase [Atractiella rhizophila]
MVGMFFEGDHKVSLKTVPVPVLASGQYLLEMRASALCGSDLRALYKPKEINKIGDEGYRDVVGGHEPCGKVIAVGSNCTHFKEGDRVVVYHIHGCGACRNCRRGTFISCENSALRKAYGWQRNGGHGEYIVADEADLVRLPDELTYLDGAMVACGLGTAYAGILRAEVSGLDTVIVTGLGPVGLGAAQLASLIGAKVLGVEFDAGRREFAKQFLGENNVIGTDDAEEKIKNWTDGYGPSVCIDCSGAASARLLCLQVARQWGRTVFIGEGGKVEFDVSKLVIHKSLTIYGSWVCSIGQMEDLIEKLVRWKFHPEVVVSHTFSLMEAPLAYETFNGGKTGKVAMIHPDERMLSQH